MELLLYGRIGHYLRSVGRMRNTARRAWDQAQAARLLQRLSRGKKGRDYARDLKEDAARHFAAANIQSAYRSRPHRGSPQRAESRTATDRRNLQQKSLSVNRDLLLLPPPLPPPPPHRSPLTRPHLLSLTARIILLPQMRMEEDEEADLSMEDLARRGLIC